MDLQLAGRVALITGGVSGIGRACVEACLGEGANVVIVDRSPSGEEVAASYRRDGARVEFIHADVTQEADVERAVKTVISQHRRLDTVLGCAGISGPVGARLDEVSADQWDQVMAVNLRGNFLVTKHAIGHLEASDVGTIVYLASDAAFVAFEGMAPYTASKGGVVMLAKAVAGDYSKVRANALCPGIVDTPMSRGDLGMPNGFEGTGIPVMRPSQIAGSRIDIPCPKN